MERQKKEKEVADRKREELERAAAERSMKEEQVKAAKNKNKGEPVKTALDGKKSEKGDDLIRLEDMSSDAPVKSNVTNQPLEMKRSQREDIKNADEGSQGKRKISDRKTPQSSITSDVRTKTPTEKHPHGYQETSRHSQGRGSSTDVSRYSEHRYSPTYDSSVRSISGESHCRETVERSLQTSQNLMSMVTGSLVPKSEPQQKTKQPQPKEVKNKMSAEQKKKQMKQIESQKSTPGAVTDIMIKEVGSNWVSLCWKKPSVTRGSPILTYKVEAWLCGEGAFWVEIGAIDLSAVD